MSVDIGQAIQEGGKRTLASNGLLFVGILWVFGIVNGLLGNTMARNAFEQFSGAMGPGAPPMGTAPMGPTLGLSMGVASLLSLLVGLIGVVVGAAAIRTFVTEETQTIPQEYFTRNLLWMVLNLVVGGIVFAIAVGIGLVFLIVPGIFLLVSLFFWNVFVVVEDENFVEGFQRSWALTKGNRIMLFVLGIVVIIIGAIVAGIFGIPQAFLPGIVGLAIAQIGSAFFSVFSVATAARTYVQLTEEEASEEATSTA